MKQLKTRNEFAALLTEKKLIGWAAEIGVAEGYNAFHLLDHWPGTLVMIDPWQILDTPGFSGHGEATDADQEARYRRMLGKAGKYKGRCRVHRATSAEAAAGATDGYFDFVYIDAIHTYEACKEDIGLWWPKVRSNGVISGHDYLSGTFNGQEYGVKQAVNEFAEQHGFQVNVTQETDWPSWWIQL